jgi:2-(1,2-epoxy-1,2-dihydrophenyl)acetyl-CoA isomerase
MSGDNSTKTHLETGSPQLLYSLHDRVAVLTLNRPEAKNALSDELSPALRRMIRQCADDAGVGAVLITGSGRAFCAGGDVKGMGNASGKSKLPFDERLADLQQRQRTLTGALLELRKPTIAALPGAAVGAGLAIALACDLRLAAESAFVTTGYARVALSGDYGISALLTRAVGSPRARELMFTSRRVDASACLAIGLVNQVLPDAELQDAAFELARELANGPTDALRSIKDNLDDALAVDFGASLNREATRLLRTAGLPDHAEAVRAFIEKRAPVFHNALP